MKSSFGKKSLAVTIIVLFFGMSVIPSMIAERSFLIETIYVDNDTTECPWDGTDCINIKQFGNIECLNDCYRKKIVSKNVTGTVDSDGLHFYGESNASIFIVTVESSSNITLADGFYKLTLRSNGTQTTAGSDYGGCWVTNGTVLVPLPKGGSSEGVMVGELRFLRLKFGEIINFTHDNREYQEYQHNQTMFGLEVNLDKNYTDFTLPPGKWHFIFTALPFDSKQDDVLSNFKVWLNFSEDLEISTSEGGKIYAFCYAEYDANIVLSKSWAFECMLNGKASFNIENTFICEFIRHPKVNGFWRVKWNTPDGIKNFNMFMINKKLYYNENRVEGGVWGIGKSGYYELITSYFDYDAEKLWAQTPFLFGFDVKLP